MSKRILEAAAAAGKLHGFIGKSQMAAMADGVRGEEKTFFIEKFSEVAAIIAGAAKTYEQDGKGEDAIVYLHYFIGGCDWYITEIDAEAEQHQAFGYADIGYGPEMGYISIVEIIAAGARRA